MSKVPCVRVTRCFCTTAVAERPMPLDDDAIVIELATGGDNAMIYEGFPAP